MRPMTREDWTKTKPLDKFCPRCGHGWADFKKCQWCRLRKSNAAAFLARQKTMPAFPVGVPARKRDGLTSGALKRWRARQACQLEQFNANWKARLTDVGRRVAKPG